MALLLKKIMSAYHYANVDMADPRTSHLFLMEQPLVLIGILVLYNYFVLNLGKKLMADRKPFNLKGLILFYDAAQVVLCALLAYKGFKIGWGGYYNWLCAPIEWEDTPHLREAGYAVWQYFILKMLDMLDTVFFVLRKKFSHITFLHVYHHTGMAILSFSAAKWLPGGHGTLIGVINCIVHVVMYSYYFTTSLYPEYKRNIWWKKHITQLQMAQFLFNIIHNMLLVFQPNCSYPKFTVMIIVPQNLFMLCLFWDFYRKAYLKKEKPA